MRRLALGMRGKLAAVSLALMALAGLASGVYLEVKLRRSLEERVQAELFRHAESLQAALKAAEDEASGIAVAAAMARGAGYRFTLIAPDGPPLADSHDAAGAGLLEHGARPELVAARETGRGVARRYSTAAGEELLFAALRLDGPEGPVVRVAMPAAYVEEIIDELRLVLSVGGVIALLVALFMSGLASHLVTRTLRTLVVEARAIAEGKSRARIRINTLSGELENLAGSVNHMAGVLEETVQKLAEERDRFRAVLEGMGGSVIALDEERRVTLANQAALALFGLEAPPLGAPLTEVARAPALLELLEEEPDPCRAVELELPGPGPRRVLARASRAPLSETLVVVFNDVTEMRRLESIRKDFVANVSHELRTPVSVICASSEALVSGALKDPARAVRFAGAVHKNAERLARLVSDLLDLSRIESGRATPGGGAVRLLDAVDRVKGGLEPVIEERGQRVELSVDADLFVRGDELALEQVLMNLLDNAVKYTPKAGHVTLRAARKGERVRIEVEDDGPGIADAHKARVFERFYRIDAGRSRELGGTGLGLSIVKHLVIAMGGSVRVEDGERAGARFVVELPEAVTHAAVAPSAARPEAAPV